MICQNVCRSHFQLPFLPQAIAPSCNELIQRCSRASIASMIGVAQIRLIAPLPFVARPISRGVDGR